MEAPCFIEHEFSHNWGGHAPLPDTEQPFDEELSLPGPYHPSVMSSPDLNFDALQLNGSPKSVWNPIDRYMASMHDDPYTPHVHRPAQHEMHHISFYSYPTYLPVYGLQRHSSPQTSNTSSDGGYWSMPHHGPISQYATDEPSLSPALHTTAAAESETCFFPEMPLYSGPTPYLSTPGITMNQIQPLPDTAYQRTGIYDQAEELARAKYEHIGAFHDAELHAAELQLRIKADPEDAIPMKIDNDYDSNTQEIESTAGQEDSEAESEYKPVQNTTRKGRPTRPSSATRNNSRKFTKSSSRSQRSSVRSSTPHIRRAADGDAASDDQSRPFTCPLKPYGCTVTFTSKNEWKRHITSQHLCFGFWRCHLCPASSTSGRGPNDFNRKDLFTQHLRRMHSGARAPAHSLLKHISVESAKKAGKKPSERKAGSLASQKAADCPDEKQIEEELEGIRAKCWRQTRAPPQKTECIFCGAVFTGARKAQGAGSGKSSDEWLEHVGRHLADKFRGGHDGEEDIEWEKDTLFRNWLVEKRLIEPLAGRASSWALVDKSAAHLKTAEMPDSSAGADDKDAGRKADADQDAEGDFE